MALSIYLDTSTIVPLIVEDALRARSIDLLRQHPARPAASDFGLAEVASALARRFRTGEISREDAFAAHDLLDRWAVRAHVIALSSVDIDEAGHMLRGLDLTLRTPDALHIAIARRLGLTLATFDRGMATAARALGLSVLGA